LYSGPQIGGEPTPTLEGGRKIWHQGRISERKRKGRDEDRHGDGKWMVEWPAVPQRSRTARAMDPALKGKWKFDVSLQLQGLTMSHAEACRWHRNRLEDDALIEHVLIPAMKVLQVQPETRKRAASSLHNFARFLADADKGDSLSAFLLRNQDLEGDEELDENEEIATYLLRFLDTKSDRRVVGALKLGLQVLRNVPMEERNAEIAGDGTILTELIDSAKLRKALPPHELAVMARVERGRKGWALPRSAAHCCAMVTEG
jgi:hypothetical protein